MNSPTTNSARSVPAAIEVKYSAAIAAAVASFLLTTLNPQNLPKASSTHIGIWKKPSPASSSIHH
jgi:hypothetical protein